ncbi:hypothetical protein [Pandoraea communis]|uniref:Uncharacterized protein n=1 Tax=Pandoraea communis TaxID=2508297 RepID=A0A5E4SXX2_9BURK|nr:hypothetical protein [Pandoraea communis]MDM8357388.1 hypothetical protein [Pandoraea communis]VVD79593.1 hypothetical protein PCO31111_01048 [Pandoraea communis]
MKCAAMLAASFRQIWPSLAVRLRLSLRVVCRGALVIQIAALVAIFVFRVPEDSFTNDNFRVWAAIVLITSVAFFNVVG